MSLLLLLHTLSSMVLALGLNLRDIEDFEMALHLDVNEIRIYIFGGSCHLYIVVYVVE